MHGTSRSGYALNLELWESCFVLPSGENPKPIISFTLGLAGALCDFPRCALLVCALLFVLSPELRVSMRHQIMLLYSQIHQRGDASRLWREKERSRILLLFWRLGLRRRPLDLNLLTAI